MYRFLTVGFLASGRKIALRYVVGFAALLIFVVTLVFPFFQCIRKTKGFLDKDGVNAIQVYAEAVSMALRKEHVSEYTQADVNADLSVRAISYRLFAVKILQGLQDAPPLMGRALLASFPTATPAVFLPKGCSRPGSELTMKEHFGIELYDQACCWPTVGAADFGLPGSLLYGLIVGTWIVLMIRWARLLEKRYPFLALILVGRMMYCLMRFECEPSVYWSFCRNLLILWVLVALGSVLRPLSLRQVPEAVRRMEGAGGAVWRDPSGRRP